MYVCIIEFKNDMPTSIQNMSFIINNNDYKEAVKEVKNFIIDNIEDDYILNEHEWEEIQSVKLYKIGNMEKMPWKEWLEEKNHLLN